MISEQELLQQIIDLKRRIAFLETSQELGPHWIHLAAPLTSTSFDGDSFSTTAKTLIDLSTVFGAPTGIKAVNVFVTVNDSGSVATDCVLVLAPNNTANSGFFSNCPRSGNDHIGRYGAVVPCDANGDIYYQIVASGVGTLDVKLQIWGYELP